MYLPLIPVTVLVVIACGRLLDRWTPVFFMALAVVLLCVTWRRNEVYRSEEALWGDTVAKLPRMRGPITTWDVPSWRIPAG
jgi:hypothetical protein